MMTQLTLFPENAGRRCQGRWQERRVELVVGLDGGGGDAGHHRTAGRHAALLQDHLADGGGAAALPGRGGFREAGHSRPPARAWHVPLDGVASPRLGAGSWRERPAGLVQSEDPLKRFLYNLLPVWPAFCGRSRGVYSLKGGSAYCLSTCFVSLMPERTLKSQCHESSFGEGSIGRLLHVCPHLLSMVSLFGRYKECTLTDATSLFAV